MSSTVNNNRMSAVSSNYNTIHINYNTIHRTYGISNEIKYVNCAVTCSVNSPHCKQWSLIKKLPHIINQ